MSVPLTGVYISVGKPVIPRKDKNCSKCKTKKPITEFYKNSKTHEVQSYCRPCVLTLARVYYKRSRLKVLKRDSEYRRKLKTDIIKAYGGKCECCNDDNWEFLSIDHINGGGRKHLAEIGGSGRLYRWLRKQGYPKDNYRLLCMNCNCSYGRYGYCPHQTGVSK